MSGPNYAFTSRIASKLSELGVEFVQENLEGHRSIRRSNTTLRRGKALKGVDMPVANVRGTGINHEVLGDRGPWIVLTGGGRMDMESFLWAITSLAPAIGSSSTTAETAVRPTSPWRTRGRRKSWMSMFT